MICPLWVHQNGPGAAFLQDTVRKQGLQGICDDAAMDMALSLDGQVDPT